MLPRLTKAIKRHGIEALTPRWKSAYCLARLYLGDFSDYFGWEWRGWTEQEQEPWSAHLYWKETWLPKWGGGYVDRLLILGEQGIGDAIFFASIIPEAMVRVKKVIYETETRLHTLLERSLPGLECDIEHEFEERRPGDAYIPAAELMRMFRRHRSHFPAKPFLKPDLARVEELRQYAGRIGVSWRARQGSMDPLKLGIDRPLSVQYGEQHPDIEAPGIDLKDDIEGVVALCSILKKVVTVPTSVAHFAAGVGKKVEIIAPELPGTEINAIGWDYPVRDDFNKLCWYKDATVFRDISTWRQYADEDEKEGFQA